MKFYGVGLVIIFIIQGFFFWTEDRVLSYFNMICAGVILVLLISMIVKEKKVSKNRGDIK
ncbi:hypothetical protein [Ureibacillus manganicus]|uniref:Uncharacterized protein n=1 Tax=Ureibacillus manganicus DSM 26584 TaxID=1384049 RepID=A0A0A3IU50_9BACL|nr:hypothetical protein [Ureibacillus manganicus]KGR78352.1 hypothetical protein CD29_11580 [Ureibacillus manganicus DSM 26584]